MRYITDDDVRGTLTVPEARDLIAAAFLALGRGEAANLARVRARAGEVTLSAMGAAIPGQGVLGAKVYPTIGGQFNFMVCLFCARTGAALACMQGNALTELRTCATTLVAAGPLANPQARTLAVFGSGLQARAHALAFVQAYPITQVRVVDPHGDPEALADALRRQHGVRASCTADAGEALDGADIVVTATRAKAPLFAADAVRPGSFIAAIGSSKPDTRELPPELLARATCVLVESRAQALAETGDLAEALDYAERVRELGPLLAQPQSWARQPQDITIYKSVGIGLEDVAVAHAIYQRLAQHAGSTRG